MPAVRSANIAQGPEGLPVRVEPQIVDAKPSFLRLQAHTAQAGGAPTHAARRSAGGADLPMAMGLAWRQPGDRPPFHSQPNPVFPISSRQRTRAPGAPRGRISRSAALSKENRPIPLPLPRCYGARA